MSNPGEEHRPLLPSDHVHFTSSTPPPSSSDLQSTIQTLRHQTKRFLTSKAGHYSVLFLVSLDIAAIFTELLITSLACEGHVPKDDAETAETALGILSLVFSSIFMVELVASILSFGLSYFNSFFHCLDAVVITAGLIIDILLRGTLEEIGSVVVVLRLWRVLKIIDELSAGAAEQMEPLSQRIEDLEKQNLALEREIDEMRSARRLTAA